DAGVLIGGAELEIGFHQDDVVHVGRKHRAAVSGVNQPLDFSQRFAETEAVDPKLAEANALDHARSRGRRFEGRASYFSRTHPLKCSRPMSCTVRLASGMRVLPNSTKSRTASAPTATGIPAGSKTTGSRAMIVRSFHRSPARFFECTTKCPVISSTNSALELLAFASVRTKARRLCEWAISASALASFKAEPLESAGTSTK